MQSDSTRVDAYTSGDSEERPAVQSVGSAGVGPARGDNQGGLFGPRRGGRIHSARARAAQPADHSARAAGETLGKCNLRVAGRRPDFSVPVGGVPVAVE